MGMVLYMDEQSASDLFGLKVSTDDKIVFITQDPDTDEPVISINRPEGGDFYEVKLSWHMQNEYFQVGVPWPTSHGRKKRSIVDSTVEYGTIRFHIPKASADPALIQNLLRKLNSLIDDESMTVRVKDNRIRIAIAMELGE
jgi:hypothetical protein